jgi:hypothetical protein
VALRTLSAALTAMHRDQPVRVSGQTSDHRPAGRAMVSATLTPRRAIRKPWRLDPRALFGLFLMLVSVGGSVVFWTTSTDTRAVLVATRDRPAGATPGAVDRLTQPLVAPTMGAVDDRRYAAPSFRLKLAGLSALGG